MIARTDLIADLTKGTSNTTPTDIWAYLAAPLPTGAISWRQDGRVIQRDGKYFARFVCYIEANTVRERLDTIVPGEWDLTLELLPRIEATETNGHLDDSSTCAFKARLQILGVIREDVGTGRDYKQAATDAFKRAAVRFGIGHELYSYEQNWIEMDGDGKYAKPVEEPHVAYVRKYGTGIPSISTVPTPIPSTHPESNTLTDMDQVSCPKCGGRMWDNRLTKRNPKAPDFKCRNRSCDGVIWPSRTGKEQENEEHKEPQTTASVVMEEELPF